MKDTAVGLFVGAFVGLFVAALLTTFLFAGSIDHRWEKRLIEAGLAHYDPLTAEWILDAEQD